MSALIKVQCWDSLHSALEIAVTAPVSHVRANPSKLSGMARAVCCLRGVVVGSGQIWCPEENIVDG